MSTKKRVTDDTAEHGVPEHATDTRWQHIAYQSVLRTAGKRREGHRTQPLLLNEIYKKKREGKVTLSLLQTT